MDMLKDRSIGKPTDSQRRIPSDEKLSGTYTTRLRAVASSLKVKTFWKVGVSQELGLSCGPVLPNLARIEY